eukprot:9340324-Ditylum_brightwellii.AAC.1
MAQSVRCIQYADSAPVQNDHMSSDRGMLGGIGRGVIPKHDDHRRLKHWYTQSEMLLTIIMMWEKYVGIV